jgi:hypothetical protein
MFPEHVASNPQDFVVGNRFGAAHATQFRALPPPMPGRLAREPARLDKSTNQSSLDK